MSKSGEKSMGDGEITSATRHMVLFCGVVSGAKTEYLESLRHS